jgi:serpin B
MRARLLWAAATLAAASVPALALPNPDTVTPAALADLGLALLRDSPAPNAVVSPLATATALGMVHAGAAGTAEREIEALFAPREGKATPFKQRLPALLKQIGNAPSPFVLAGRVWLDPTVAAAVPAGFTQRMATRYAAGAQRVDFKAAEAARGQINAWTAEHTAGRITELLPPGSINSDTKLALTTAIHFRSPWAQPFDAAATEPRPFAGAAQPVATMQAERPVLQAQVDGTQLYALPFARDAFTLLLALPAEGSSPQALLQGLNGAQLQGWRTALQAKKCQFALPRFAIAPKAAAMRPLLEKLGVKTVFTGQADLRPMLGSAARGVHLDDVHQAAGITIDEQGGEAVAAAAATFQSKTLALPAPPCAVDRPFVFAVLHAASGTPLFMGRVGDPSLKE